MIELCPEILGVHVDLPFAASLNMLVTFLKSSPPGISETISTSMSSMLRGVLWKAKKTRPHERSR
jgi:hypothetical protein